MRPLYRGLFWTTFLLAAICLAGMIGTVFYVGRLSWESQRWQETVDRELMQQHLSPAPKSQAADAPLTAEQKAELQNSVAGTRAMLIAEIHAADAEERAILDRLITLVGVFSAILGLCTFATVKLAREDAKDQAARIEGDLKAFKVQSKSDLDAFKSVVLGELDTFKNKTLNETEGMKTSTAGRLQDLREETRLKLEELTRTTTAKIDEFQRKIWSEMPEMRTLKESLRELMVELDRTIPNDADWNDALAYDSLSTSKRESILITEGTVSGLRIFVSRDTPVLVTTLAKLYRSLAHFYFGRYRAEKTEADGERAHLYTKMAGELEPNDPAADRLRGAIYLAQYRIYKAKVTKAAAPIPKKEQEVMETLLKSAEDFLEDALEKVASDAGAALNFALAARYREHFDRAIEISEAAIGNREHMTPQQVHKYLPSLYVNLACYLARKADKGAPADADPLREKAVMVLEGGLKYLQEKKNKAGIKALGESIAREKDRMDAFRNLGGKNLGSLDLLIAESQKE